ncbi:unnamed protein product [Chrysoparadoxa australica]
MDAIASVQFYVDKIVSDPRLGGMKVLLLDEFTTQVVAMVYSQSQILEKEVYLVERLGARLEAMPHLKAAVFVRPTRQNIELLCNEVAHPKYAEYHLFFSNILPQDLLQQLATADADHEAIKQVQEYYADFLAVNSDLVSGGIPHSLKLNLPNPPHGCRRLFEQNVDAVLSLLLAMKKKPSQIRYSSSSAVARKLAAEVSSQISSDGIFDFRRHEGPLLLILDRKDDPVTPLLSQWTYQAMVHELLGLNNNRVVLKGAPGVKKDLHEVVLSSTQDKFFAEQRLANFGDLGGAVKDLMGEYQQATKLNEKLQTIEDMQAFLERYPAFRSQSLNVSKHVAVLGELARLVEVYGLLDVSQLEQELACNDDHALHQKDLLAKLKSPQIQGADKLRLAMLYLLRYEDAGTNLIMVKARLTEAGLPPERVELLDALRSYCGRTSRGPGLYGQSTLMSKIGKSITASLQGIDNVYCQHLPLLVSVLESFFKGKLRDDRYPCVGPAAAGKPQEVIVYMVGGTTMEEAKSVSEMNATMASGRVVLGGSCIHNSTSFIDELSASFGGSGKIRGGSGVRQSLEIG